MAEALIILWNELPLFLQLGLKIGAIILPPSKSLHAVAPEVSISELVWSMDPDCRHARPGLRRAPSFTDSFAWVSG